MKKLLMFAFIIVCLCMSAVVSASDTEMTIDSIELANGYINMTVSCPESMIGTELTVLSKTTDSSYTGDSQYSYIHQQSIESKTVALTLGLKEELKDDFQIVSVGGTNVDDPITCTVVYGLVGDVDGDGKVTAGDASLLLKYVVDIETPPEGSTLQHAVTDVTKDSLISSGDASYVLKYIIGLIGSEATDIDTVQTFAFYHN